LSASSILKDICIKQGFMNKQGAVRKSWKMRWFVLQRNMLLYFKAQNQKKPLGVLDIVGSIFDDKLVDPSKKNVSFSLVVPKSFTAEKQYRNRAYIFVTKTEQEKEEWVKELQKFTMQGVSRRMFTMVAPVLYLDANSAECRALAIYCQEAKIELDINPIDLVRSVKLPAEFLRRNPQKLMPFYAETDFSFSDIKSIFNHLHKKFEVSTHWHPSTKMDEELQWYQVHFAKMVNDIVDFYVFKRLPLGDKMQALDAATLTAKYAEVNKILQQLENKLKDSKFLVADEPCFLDILICCELEQLSLAKVNLSPYPLIKKFQEEVQAKISVWKPIHDEFQKFVQYALETISKYTDTPVVFGATGTIGREVISYLTKKNSKVMAMTTKLTMEKVKFLQQLGLAEENVNAGVELLQPDTYAPVFNNANRMLLITPNSEKMVEQSKLAVDTAVKGGVQYIVKLSIMGAENSSPSNKIAAWHHEVEQHIKSKGVHYTFVRPNLFYHNIVSLSGMSLRTGELKLPLGDAKLSWVEVKDVAPLMVDALINGSMNKEFNVTGPEQLSGADMAQILSKEVGKEIKYVDISHEEAKKHYTSLGLAPVWIEAFLELCEAAKKGAYSPITNDLELFMKISNEKPTTFQEYVQAHLDKFK